MMNLFGSTEDMKYIYIYIYISCFTVAGTKEKKMMSEKKKCRGGWLGYCPFSEFES